MLNNLDSFKLQETIYGECLLSELAIWGLIITGVNYKELTLVQLITLLLSFIIL